MKMLLQNKPTLRYNRLIHQPLTTWITNTKMMNVYRYFSIFGTRD